MEQGKGALPYEVTGPWRAADDSRNHLELAPTSEPDVIAMRSTFRASDIFFATAGQLRAVVTAIESGQMRELITAP